MNKKIISLFLFCLTCGIYWPVLAQQLGVPPSHESYSYQYEDILISGDFTYDVSWTHSYNFIEFEDSESPIPYQFSGINRTTGVVNVIWTATGELLNTETYHSQDRMFATKYDSYVHVTGNGHSHVLVEVINPNDLYSTERVKFPLISATKWDYKMDLDTYEYFDDFTVRKFTSPWHKSKGFK